MSNLTIKGQPSDAKSDVEMNQIHPVPDQVEESEGAAESPETERGLIGKMENDKPEYDIKKGYADDER